MDANRLLLTVLVWGGLSFNTDPLLGQEWAPTTAPAFSWLSLACSADATKLYAVNGPWGGVVWALYRSTNSGATWEPTTAPTKALDHVTCSGDGTKVVAAGSEVYLSQDSGSTWTKTADTNVWGGVAASSADGSRLPVANGGGFVSTNAGASWKHSDWPSPRETLI